MIVDVHTHIWESADQLGPAMAERLRKSVINPWETPIASTEAHDQAMQPVQYAIIHGFASQHLKASIPIEQVAGYVRRNPEKYVGFAGIDPMDPQCMQQLRDARDLGLAGVTISPAAGGYHPTHSRALRLYEHCEAANLPVMIHTAMQLANLTRMEFAQPYLLDEVARTFPELRIVLARVGHPWVQQTLVLIGKHQHVYAELSDVVSRPWELYTLLLSSHQQHVIDHLLLGTDFPFFTPEKAITALYSVNMLIQGTNLPGVSREQLRGIVERDALSCLGITSPVSGQNGTQPMPDPKNPNSTQCPAETDDRTQSAGEQAQIKSPTVKEGIR